MAALDKKLWRDLNHMRGQVLAIALVMACGVATFVMSLSTLDSLQLTRTSYYDEYRFAEVFASLKRAPEHVGRRIADIPGVRTVQTRVKAPVNIEIEGYTDPIRGQLVSYPEEGRPVLNDLYLREGRLLEPGREDETLLIDAFADAHGLRPSDAIDVIINGRRRSLTVVGIVLSPEFIYQAAPGALFPDFERYGTLWMGRPALASAYDMEGAFNDVALTLYAGTQPEAVIDRLDLILEPYGGLGAYPRADQMSHYYLSQEMEQLDLMATMLPAIFLGVAAFLLNVVLNRLISTQREQIAILKAFGYSNLAVGGHYVKMVLAVAALGVVAGTAMGAWFGQGLSAMYMEFYRFPYLDYILPLRVVLIAIAVTASAAVVGTLHAVRNAVILPPAEAMRPEPPQVYHESIVERLGLKRWMDQPSRMIIRNLERQPFKALLSIVGIAFACSIVIMGRFFGGAFDYMVDVQYGLAQREDLVVTFAEPTSREALHELGSLAGVRYGQPFRSVPVRLHHGHRTYRTAIQGVVPGGDLQRLLDMDLDPVDLPPAGFVLTEHLGNILGAQPGDCLTVDVLEGARPTRRVCITRFVQQYIGLGAYMEIQALNRLLHEGDAISGVFLEVDAQYETAIYRALQDRPRVAGVEIQKRAIEDLYDTMGEQILVFAFFITFFAGAIAFGVVYNSARIALSERGRELASLRVLGLRRGEIAYILLGELAVLTLVALPFGFALGWGLCWLLVLRFQMDIMRIPMVVQPDIFALAAAVVIASAVLSGLIVRRRLNRLDLVSVLKTRE